MKGKFVAHLFASLIIFIVVICCIPNANAEEKTVEELINTLVGAIEEKNDPLRNNMYFELRKKGGEAVDPLLELMKHENDDVSGYAAFILGWIADERAVDPLIEMLKSESSTRKRAAARALANMQAKAAVDAIIPLLEDEDRYVRQDAAYSLGLIRDKRAVPALKKATNDPDEVVRYFAKEAIDRIEKPQWWANPDR